MQKTIAITGIGCITPWGDHVTDIRNYRDEHGNEQLLHVIEDFNLKQYISRKGLRTLPKSTKMAIAATKLALEDAKALGHTEVAPERIGVFVGNAMSYLNNINDFLAVTYEDGVESVSPMKFPNTVLNNISGWISIVFNMKGVNSTVNTGQTSGLDAIIQAKSYLEMGVIDQAIVVGVEDIGKGAIHNSCNGKAIDRSITEAAISFVLARDMNLSGDIYGYIERIDARIDVSKDRSHFLERISSFMQTQDDIEQAIWGSGNDLDDVIETHLSACGYDKIDKENVFPIFGLSYAVSSLFKCVLSLFQRGKTVVIETNETGNRAMMVVEAEGEGLDQCQKLHSLQAAPKG